MTAWSRKWTTALVFASTLFLAVAVHADEIKVMTSGAFTAPYLELCPRFERDTRDKIITLTTTMGVGVDSIPNRIARGESVDVIIVAAAALDELIRDGRVVAASRIDLAKSDIGIAVRAGAAKPDISSVEALKRTLLQAKSIAYSASVSGNYLTTELFQRLGIADQVLAKSRRVEGERVGAVVARGEAEIGFQQISELISISGIDYVGPLPAEVQRTTVLSAGVAVKAEHPDAARAFIRFLASPDSADAIRKSGLEPLAQAVSFAQVKVLMSGGFTPAFIEVQPEIERTIGLTITTGSGASQGTGPDTIGAQLRRGEPADVVILSREGLNDLIAEGRIVAGTDVNLAQTLIGMAVRSGAPKPDISTVDAFKQALLRAKAVAMPGSTSGIYMTETLFPKLGIAGRVTVKMTTRGAASVAMVAAGEADFALQPVSELLHHPGVDFAGTIPAEVQRVATFAAGVVTGSKAIDASKRLIAFLASEKALAAIRNSGMEPVRPR